MAVIPAILGKLSHLKAFWLDHNQLTTIPATLGQLSQLQWLSLSYNQLTDLPVEIKRLDRCTTVLNGNPLKNA
ncbi:leucine-rich repeat domain-containing protein [Parachlamydia sp. AcF125]|uniref:leucine-rich repeat domain-containing protein n=1 Tax=Parachlamydia sp. AcF125 TaxID=2795736 RepID=UPI001BC8F033|nr:leucine-rich repeat domain-containing protein [Parachlamydia sp. AcF125]